MSPRVGSGQPPQTKGKETTNPRPSGSNVECFRCHGYGHVASRCPTRTLTMTQEGEDQTEEDHLDLTFEGLPGVAGIPEESPEGELDNAEAHIKRCEVHIDYPNLRK